MQAERAEHGRLALAHKGLGDQHASKSDLCKKLEEQRAAEAELASQLGAEVDALKQECSGLPDAAERPAGRSQPVSALTATDQ